MTITNKVELATAYKQGPYAWPGGYPVYPITVDGELFCWKCFKSEYSLIASDVQDQVAGCWRVTDLHVNWEDTSAYCGNCSTHLESAYGEDSITA